MAVQRSNDRRKEALTPRMRDEEDSFRAARGPLAPNARLQLLNGFGLFHGQVELVLPLGAQRLVAFLALHPGPVIRPYVAGSLWLDVNDERAAANLRSALWRLHSVSVPIVLSSRTHLRLDPSVAIDHATAVESARRLLDPRSELGDAELAIKAGELLPDWYDEWVTIERERFRFLRLNALEQLCLRLADRGRLGEAVDAGLSAVAAEPLRESAHRALVRVHLAAGNWFDALHQYETYRVLLEQQLELPPSEEMEALIRPLKQPRRARNTGSIVAPPH